MRITQYFNDNAKNAQDMRYNIDHARGDIFEVYKRPSSIKIKAFEAIRNAYMYNDTVILGVPCKSVIVPKQLNKLNNKMYLRYINGTLNIAGASSHFFSTVAIFEDVETNERYIIKETHASTYMCKL